MLCFPTSAFTRTLFQSSELYKPALSPDELPDYANQPLGQKALARAGGGDSGAGLAVEIVR
jgi:hypothetical protein